MKKRKNLRPKERFRVFERDNFICQYCGRSPEIEGVVLEVDHIVSVKDGGDNQINNLTTSCFDCNRGKGAKSKPKKTIKQIEENIEREKERIKQIKRINKKNKELVCLKKESKELSRNWMFEIIGDNFVDKIYSEIEKQTKKFGKKKTEEALEIIAEKEIDGCSSWIKYFKGILKNLNSKKETREMLLFFSDLIQNPYTNGRFDWRIKESYDGVRKCIDNFSEDLVRNKNYKDVRSEIESMLEDEIGIEIETSDGSKNYTNEQCFIISDRGKEVNLLIIDRILSWFTL